MRSPCTLRISRYARSRTHTVHAVVVDPGIPEVATEQLSRLLAMTGKQLRERIILHQHLRPKHMPLDQRESVTIELDQPLSEALKRAARRARKSPADMLQRLLREKLEEDGDYKAVTGFRKRRGRTFSVSEIKRRHGLAD